MSKISVIILVYNVREYVSRCLDSVLAQTFGEFEVICVDDGSTDGSGEICDQYVKKDCRVRVFHNSNSGISRARNFALAHVNTEWFAYVDADDWIEPDYLEILYNNAVENACDISACNFQRNNKFCMGYEGADEKIVFFKSPKKCIHSFICSKDSMQGMVWNKLYRTERYKDIAFDESVKMTEDCLYTYHIMKNCKNACYVSKQLYHWYFRHDGESQSKKIECDFTPANVFLYLYEDTLSMQDYEVSKMLQQNYIKYVLKILIFAQYAKSDSAVLDAKKRCGEWKADVWAFFDVRTKLKYMLVMRLPFLVPVVRFMRK